MSKLRLERKAPRDVATAITAATTYLVRIGYEPEPAAYGKVQLVYARGSPSAARLDEHRHTLRILEERGGLVFEFSAGLGSSGMVIDSERKELERRTDAALAFAPASATQVGCRICGQINAVSAASCEACGSMDFR